MTTNEFIDVVNDQFDICRDVLTVKAKEYATEDRLHNFECAAGMMECSPEEALAGMMAKHTISIYDMCRSGKDYPIELWNEKITDHIDYLILLKAVIVDKKKKKPTETLEDLINNEKRNLAKRLHANGVLISDIANWLTVPFLTVTEWLKD